jgi:hypothetical protein
MWEDENGMEPSAVTVAVVGSISNNVRSNIPPADITPVPNSLPEASQANPNIANCGSKRSIVVAYPVVTSILTNCCGAPGIPRVGTQGADPVLDFARGMRFVILHPQFC